LCLRPGKGILPAPSWKRGQIRPLASRRVYSLAYFMTTFVSESWPNTAQH
jgi:hypothetical protein